MRKEELQVRWLVGEGQRVIDRRRGRAGPGGWFQIQRRSPPWVSNGGGVLKVGG